MLLYNLAQNPEKQKKLTDEVFRLLPEIDSPMSKDILENSPYFRATLKESLRVTPLIVGTMRAAGQDLVLSGYKVPKGVRIGFLNFLLELTNSIVNLHIDQYCYVAINCQRRRRILSQRKNVYARTLGS